MPIEKAYYLIKLAKTLEEQKNYSLSDRLANLAIRLSEDLPTAMPGQELKPGQEYLVDTQDQSVFDEVAKNGTPMEANVGGAKVLVTHGSKPSGGSESLYIVPNDAKQRFLSNNPNFNEQNPQLSEQDSTAGIKAAFNNQNNLMLNASGMQKYVGTKWISCFDTVNGPNPQAFFKSKGEIGVSSIVDPSTGQPKTILKQMP